jgi:hypothetical protein
MAGMTPKASTAWPLALLGAVSLGLGVAVYRVVRPGLQPGWLMQLTGPAPSFFHALAFVLWIALALQWRGLKLGLLAAAWALLATVLEAFQHPALHSLLPQFFTRHWRGSFDPWDIVASVLGACVAAMLVARRAG